jgi:protein-disulfide isomerase
MCDGARRVRRLATAAVTVAAISTAGLIAAGCGSGGGARGSSTAEAKQPAAEVAALLAGIPQRGDTLGNAKAPVTLQYFGDLQCPFCRRFTVGSLRSLIAGYVRGGRLKIEYRSLETATQDPETFRIQQVAALAAGRQNKMWNYIELFYHEQGHENSGYVTESYLQRLAQQVGGLNLIAWTAARNDSALTGRLLGDARLASDTGLRSTPSFRIGQAPNTPYVSAIRKLLSG